MVGKSPLLQEELPEIIQLLRQPAGDDPRFATMEGMQKHRIDFLSHVHDAWKRVHDRALDQILQIEAFLRSPDASKFPPGFASFLRYSMAIWRRVNDALVWSLGFEGHDVRTICHRRDRPALSYANPTSIRRLLAMLNRDPLTFALWADATSCVDVGDVICRSFSGGPTGILEVKEGSVNDRIVDLISSPGDLEARVQQIETFSQLYGEKGIKQLGRVAKQFDLLAGVQKILQSGHGFDPHWQAHVFVHEVQTRDQSYDHSLAAMLDLSNERPVIECIDRCLWVYIDRDPAKTLADRVQAFSAALFRRSPTIREWNRQWREPETLGGVIALDANLFEPVAVPLFFRPFSAITIREILLGSLKDRVLLYFDWVEYAAIVKGLGAELTWSSRKAARAQHSLPYHQRLMMVGERIPQIALPNGRAIQGQSKVYRVLFDGILPSVVAAQYAELLHKGPGTAEEERSRDEEGPFPQ